MIPVVNIELWMLAICLIFPFLCLVTTVCLFFIKKSPNESGSQKKSSRNKNNGIDFEDQVAFQIACQQLDILMVKMAGDIEKQRMFLKNYVERKVVANHSSVFPEKQMKEDLDHVFKEKNINESIENTVENLIVEKSLNAQGAINKGASYKEINRLFHSGMTPEEIARATNIPQSEVYLYIKLHLDKEKHFVDQTASLKIAV